jgi:hypothetical protein
MINRRTSPLLLLLLGFAAIGAACKTQSLTEIILEIGTNIPVPSEMDTLSLNISSTNLDGAVLNKMYSLGTGPGQIMLPKRMTLAPSGTGATITVKVDGLLATNVIVSRTVITRFLQDQSLLLRIDLLRECEGITACPSGETCVNAGVCTDANITPGSLPHFDPSQPPKPAPLDRDAGPPSDGANDAQSADGLPGAGGDGPSDLADAASDLGADGLLNLTDAASDLGADGLLPGPSDGASDGQSADGPLEAGGDGPPDVTDGASGLGTDSFSPDVPAGRPNSAACTLAAQCQSGFCVDGVCCNSGCSDTCMSCKVPDSTGTCSPVPVNNSSEGDCPDQGVASCGNNGLCDGKGACQKYAAGLKCQATCDPKSATLSVFTCNGSGTCGLSTPQACAPYNCDVSGCKQSCVIPTDCALGYVCSPSGTCVPPEDCMNGIDDDGNGKVDCDDPACSAGYMCVPQVPAGFTGPGEVYEGLDASQACDPLYTKDYFTGYVTPKCDVSCSACTCGSPAGVTCGNPGFSSQAISPSGVPTCPKPTTVEPGICTTVSLPSGASFATFAGAASGGSCLATGGTLNQPDPIWNAGHLCEANAKGGLGCASGYVCWPKPQAPFFSQVCVFAVGDLPCSDAGYPAKRSYYDSQKYGDTRSCSTCACNTPSGGSCPASLGMWTKGLLGTTLACTDGASATYSVPSACQAVPPNIVDIMFTSKSYTGGSCTPTSVVATPNGGACTPLGGPTTACCTP